jgi:hypothetical protein
LTNLPTEQELTKAIESFLKRNSVQLKDLGNELPQLFEIASFNLMVDLYDKMGYKTEPANLQNGEFCYKLQPNGLKNNFSWFEVSRRYYGKLHQYELHENLSVQVAGTEDCFLHPDVVVIKKDTAEKLPNSKILVHFNEYWYVKNKNLKTFLEAKYLKPFPELLLNFPGMLMALRPNNKNYAKIKRAPRHVAPLFMLAGIANDHSKRISNFITEKYHINLVFSSLKISKANMKKVKKIKLT